MSDFQIVIGTDILVSDYSHNIDTVFFIHYQGKSFPCERWTDFSYPILNTWTNLMLRNTYNDHARYDLFFQDGPYKMIIRKTLANLEIDCIHLNQNTIELSFECTFLHFLSALYDAHKTLSNILYQNGLHLGMFKPAYEQTILTTKELKLAIKKLKSI